MHRIVGLDLAADAVRLVALESGFRGFRVLEAREAQLPAEGTQAERIKAALATLGALSDDTVAIALPGAQVASHLFTLPFVDQKRIEQVLPAEVESAIPFEMDEVVWDHAILSQEGGKSRVAVAVVKKELLRESLRLLHEAGVEPRVVTFAPLALAALEERGLLDRTGPLPEAGAAAPAAAAPAPAAGSTCVLLEAGPERASLVLVGSGQVLLVRSLPTTGPLAWQAAVTDPAALVRLAAPLVRDLKITLRTQAGTGREQPSQLLVAGPLATLPGAVELLSAELELPAAPLAVSPGLLPAGVAQAPPVALALGLALRAQQPRGRINFRRGEFAFTKDLSKARGQLVRLATAAALVLLLAVGLGVARVVTLGRQAADYDEALCNATKRVLGNCLRDYKIALSQMKGENSKAAGLPRVSATQVLAELVAHLPEATVPQLEDVEVTTTSVRIKGVADGFSQVDQIKDALKADKCFGEIKPPRSEKLQGSTKVSFVIDFPYVCTDEKGGA